MPIVLNRAKLAQASSIHECGHRAFQNDDLQKALFINLPNNPDYLVQKAEFHLHRIEKYIESPDIYTLIATDDAVENGSKILGYAVWYETTDKPAVETPEHSEYPTAMNVELYMRLRQMLDEAKKELLDCDTQRAWYLRSLAVDPEFGGRGIGSMLVQWGLEKAAENSVPAYLESTPSAVGLYKRCGFMELKKLVVFEDKNYYLTVMLKHTQSPA